MSWDLKLRLTELMAKNVIDAYEEIDGAPGYGLTVEDEHLGAVRQVLEDEYVVQGNGEYDLVVREDTSIGIVRT